MQLPEIPLYLFHYVSMDMFFAEYKGKKRKFLITVDYSDFFELDILSDMTAETLVHNICKKTFNRREIPVRKYSDNGTNFENKLMRNLGQDQDFEVVTLASKHQQGNGKSEAAVKIAKKVSKKSGAKRSRFMVYIAATGEILPIKQGQAPYKNFIPEKRAREYPAL